MHSPGPERFEDIRASQLKSRDGSVDPLMIGPSPVLPVRDGVQVDAEEIHSAHDHVNQTQNDGISCSLARAELEAEKRRIVAMLSPKDDKAIKTVSCEGSTSKWISIPGCKCLYKISTYLSFYINP